MAFSPAPFSHEALAVKQLENCDYSCRWTLQELWDGARPSRPIRVIADGVFDLFHVGHANLFRQIKSDLLPPWCEVYTIARTCGGEEAALLKSPPIQDEVMRREMLRHCRYVDEVIYELAWATTEQLCRKHKVDFVAHDACPYGAGSGENNDLYGWAKQANMFLATRRTPEISSTHLRQLMAERKTVV